MINSKRNDTIYDLPTYTYHGNDHIVEQLGEYKFKINPKSFFQTNSDQAKVLYDVTKDFAALKPDDVVYDLYTGVGSIAIYVSKLCKQVVGIEQVEAAIEDAKENAEMNEVTNCSFYAGDVRMVLKPEFISKNGKPNVVITDPPARRYARRCGEDPAGARSTPHSLCELQPRHAGTRPGTTRSEIRHHQDTTCGYVPSDHAYRECGGAGNQTLDLRHETLDLAK